MPEPYTTLARYYDLENADFTEDLDFWLELADEHGGPVLELGCGTGRVLLPLARRGHAVTGVDNAPEMLARLTQKLAAAQGLRGAGGRLAPPTVLEADFATFTAEARFPLALMPFNTFMHLLTLEAQVAALANIRRHLVLGGLLALDLINPGEAYAAESAGLTLERTFTDGDRLVQQFALLAVDRAAQLARITWLYDSLGPEGRLERAAVPLTLRYTFPGEMRLLLEKTGFALAHLYGDYARAPFADGAERMLVLATAV